MGQRSGLLTWLGILLLFIFAPGIAVLLIIINLILSIGRGFRRTQTQKEFRSQMGDFSEYVEPVSVTEIDVDEEE